MAEQRMQRKGEGLIANISVTGGFSHTDLPKCGVTVSVTTRGDEQLARQTALDFARHAWSERARYVRKLLTVDEAITIAKEAEQPIILADVSDNPGGGGRGNTAYLLSALHEARLPGAALGAFIDPELAAEAHELGERQRFHAIFNRVESEFSERFATEAEVVRLTDGKTVGRRSGVSGQPPP